MHQKYRVARSACECWYD